MRSFGRRKRASIDENFKEYVMQEIGKSGVEVLDEEGVESIAVDSIEGFADLMGKRVASLALRDKRTLRANQKMDYGFNRRLERRYRRAFQAYIVATSCAREAGESAAAIPADDLTDPQAATRTALMGLHAKSCRVAGEVYALLVNGFPEGALARCRTLHEMAVVAGALADSVGDSENEDLAIRFLEHEVVDLRSSARRYQEDHAILGMEPLEQEFIDQVEDRFNAVMAKYGREFKGDYGWAKKYCPDANLAGLEKKVQMGHMRGYYKWANNEVHAGSRSLLLNVSEFRGQRMLRAGKTNVGLTDPASMALNSLFVVTVMLLAEGIPESVNLTGLVTMKALNEMCAQASEMFLRVDREIMEDEENILRSMNLGN
ncbi:hypothetical protein GT030_19245 [Streptomyces sp. SID1328]|uniref:DUF5677 domain-containing protein n=1 Tax=Streptomyces sp. SID1328 TaxID=2690250 RepID=UPI0013686929|nr:DUF5677 domain-containing protein [Streptomyces sp. SID1328]MYV40945.1 hypothetical protein [Streptomyces sp. SID1328]